MKKIITGILLMFVFSSCEQLGLDPSSKLVGTWKHTNTGAAAGGGGIVISNGIKYKLTQVKNDPTQDIVFKKNGECNYGKWDKYKVSGDVITFSSSNTNNSSQFDYKIFMDGLTLYANLSEWKKFDPQITSIDLTYSFDKQ